MEMNNERHLHSYSQLDVDQLERRVMAAAGWPGKY